MRLGLIIYGERAPIGDNEYKTSLRGR